MRPILIPSIRFVAALAIFSVLPVAQSLSAVADCVSPRQKGKDKRGGHAKTRGQGLSRRRSGSDACGLSLSGESADRPRV